MGLKEQIASSKDLATKTVEVTDNKIKVEIRRLSIKQRDEVLSGRDLKQKSKEEMTAEDIKAGSDLSVKLVVMGTVEELTEDEVRDMPAVVIEAIANEIMEFNGWTVQGRRFLDDQFRNEAGSPVPVSPST